MQANVQFGPYRIIEEVGKGGMATVFRARQASVDRDVAIKVIQRNSAADPETVARFQREARMIAYLEHPHIIPIYDFDGAHNPPYIVMRYIDSGTLKDVLDHGLLPHDEVAYLLRQISSALAYAHRQGIIHRDIKPSNILIDREGNAFISDMGLARLVEAGTARSDITETGALLGTPDYMAPEQALGEEDIDHRADLYALAVMAFEMLAGQVPFPAANGMQALTRRLSEPPPSICTILPSLPSDLDGVMKKALAFAPEARYPDALAFTQAVTAALGVAASTSPVRLRAVAVNAIRQISSAPGSTATSAATTEQNKVVAVLMVGAEDYAEAVAARSSDEALRRAMGAMLTGLEACAVELGGLITSRTDTELVAVWGAALAREDDSERAVRAALGMMQTLRDLGSAFFSAEETPPLRIGVHSGAALISPVDQGQGATLTATGPTLTLARRLMQSADGLILVSHEVFRQVVGVFNVLEDEPIKVRGRQERVLAYRVMAAKPRAFRASRYGVEGVDSSLIGREGEMKALQRAFIVAVEDRETQVRTLIGEAGVGKSRLLHEFNGWAELRPELYYAFEGRATAATLQRHHGLLRDLLFTRFQVQDDDPSDEALAKIERGVAEITERDDEAAHFLAYLCGIDVSDSPYLKALLGDGREATRRARQVFVRFITMAAQAGPLVMRLDDLHFADDASLDALSDLFSATPHSHLLAVVAARPSLLERRPTWGSGQPFHDRLVLKPLDKQDSRDLASELLKKVADVPKTLRDLLVERAEGNPLYMEELVKMLIDDRVILKESADVWRLEAARLDALDVPLTLSALMEARLDTLLAQEKLLLQRASVIGRTFYDRALAFVDAADETHISDAPALLARLVERGFIYQREISALAGSTEYLFVSAMLRDTLYDRLLERQIRAYHLGAAQWRASLEHAEIDHLLIAEHYQKAGEPTQAAAYLARAGERAAQRSGYREALAHFESGLALLGFAEADVSDTEATVAAPQDGPLVTLLIGLGDAAHQLSRFDQARAALERAFSLVSGQPKQRVEVLCRLSFSATSSGDFARARAMLDQAAELAKGIDDHGVQARLAGAQSGLSLSMADYPATVAYAEAAIGHAEAMGDTLGVLRNLSRLGIALINSGNNEAGLARFHTALDLARQVGHRANEATFLINIGDQYRSASRLDEAEQYSLQALAILREVGHLSGESILLCNLALIAMARQQHAQAAARLLESLNISITTRHLPNQVSGVVLAAMLRAAQGDHAEAARVVGAALHHPAANWNTKSLVEQEIMPMLEAALTPAALAEAQAAGADADFEALLAALVADLAQTAG